MCDVVWIKLILFYLFYCVNIGKYVEGKFINYRSSPNSLKGARKEIHMRGDEATLSPHIMIMSRGPYPCDDMTEKPRTTVWIRPSLPDHIDELHYQVTTPVPFYTVGPPISPIGFYPTTRVVSPCEQLYNMGSHGKAWWEKGGSDESLWNEDGVNSAEYIRGPFKPRMMRIQEKYPHLLKETTDISD